MSYTSGNLKTNKELIGQFQEIFTQEGQKTLNTLKPK